MLGEKPDTPMRGSEEEAERAAGWKRRGDAAESMERNENAGEKAPTAVQPRGNEGKVERASRGGETLFGKEERAEDQPQLDRSTQSKNVKRTAHLETTL